MDSVSKIGDRIRRLREERKLTQQALADALHVKRETINMWENGLRDLKTGSIIALSDFFNVSSDYLLGRVDFRSEDIDVQSICKKTGLSGEAVESLIELQNNDVIYFYDNENGEAEPMFPDWIDRKEYAFKVINCLLSWPLLDDVISLSEELHDRLKGQTIPLPTQKDAQARKEFTKLKEAAKSAGMEQLVLHPIEYDDFKNFEVNDRVRVIADRLYRLVKYGTVVAPDGKLYHNDTLAFEIAMVEALKNGKA